jgi:hypothetical protein
VFASTFVATADCDVVTAADLRVKPVLREAFTSPLQDSWTGFYFGG